MQESKGEYFLHFVWTTQQRHPLLIPEVERSVHRCLQSEAQRLRCSVLAVGGMPDHVHLAVKAPTLLSPAQIMKQLKGVSSKLASDEFARGDNGPLTWFRWQEGYGVFSFSASQREQVVQYIRNQKQHHANGKLWLSCETD